MIEKRYSPSDVEEKLYKAWEQLDCFKAAQMPELEPYTIMMPPPNVTGSLHIGHALTFTLQDILIRFYRMQGYDCLWQPGTDHAGIATQMVVERQLAEKEIFRRDLGREEFVKRVWEWKEESGGVITKQLRRLGASPDWDRERFTLDEGLSDAVIKVFVKLYREKIIYRDKRLVNWDPKLHTAISDLEVEQREVLGKMWYFKYQIEGKKNKFLTVGTTRPETMLGDTAVAVNPQDERYKDLVGNFCILPIVGRRLPIVADDYADKDKGTGVVKITPAHDFNDFEVGLRHNLEQINIFDENAAINNNAPEKYIGLDRFEARKSIVAEMDELGLLEKVEENLMFIPYGDRSGVVIEPWLTDQWFADAYKLAQPAIEAVETGKTKFVPKQWENTYFEWMRNIQPWCISRQLWWGHQIPAWFGPDGHVFVEETEEKALEEAKKHYGKKVTLKRDQDVLDTWFSSALWPFSTLGWPSSNNDLERYYPGSVLVTGFDIIFFWVARMMMMGIYFMDKVPFKEVYIHALVRDEKGQKMSKSKGNVLDPLHLCDKYGTDAVRFTLSSMAAQGRDIKLSEQRIAGYRNFITKIWNSARFCELNSCSRSQEFLPKKLNSNLNIWIVSKVSEAGNKISLALKNYYFNEASDILYHFTWHTFCDWYLECVKPILGDKNHPLLIETQSTVSWVLDQILIIAHPIMPFVTEELWSSISSSNRGMLINEKWPNYSDFIYEDSENEMDWVIEFVSKIRSIRSEINIAPKEKIEVSAYIQKKDTEFNEYIMTNYSLLKRLANLMDLKIINDANVHEKDLVTPDSQSTATLSFLVKGVSFKINLSGIIDIEKEKKRLIKESVKLDKEVTVLSKKLQNDNFLKKADPLVVEETRSKLILAKQSEEKVLDFIKSIKV